MLPCHGSRGDAKQRKAPHGLEDTQRALRFALRAHSTTRRGYSRKSPHGHSSGVTEVMLGDFASPSISDRLGLERLFTDEFFLLSLLGSKLEQLDALAFKVLGARNAAFDAT